MGGLSLPLTAIILMKKILVKFLLIIFLALLVLPIIVLAADANPLTNLKSAAPELITGDTIYDLTGKIIQALLGFIGVLFIILIILIYFVLRYSYLGFTFFIQNE